MSKSRLDQLMVERGLAGSRAKAQALVLAGQVFSGERRLDKPGQTVAPDVALEVRAPGMPYVSRGGLKLAHALDHFGIDPAGMVALDIGASTGGFTDVLLQRGARRVYAVDVGRGQLDWRLRAIPRRRPRKDQRPSLASRARPEPVDLVVCDVSFISLELALPAPRARRADGAADRADQAAVRGRQGAGGQGRRGARCCLAPGVCARISRWLAEEQGWRVRGVVPSPITGPKGNREFLVAADHHVCNC